MKKEDKKARSVIAGQYGKRYRSAFYENSKLQFGWAFFMCLVMAVVYAFTGITMKLITDTAIQGTIRDVLPMTLFVIGYFIFRFLAELCLNAAVANFSGNAIAHYKNRVFRDIMGKSIHSFQRENVGSYISVLTNDANVIKEDYLENFFNILQFSFVFVVTLALMFFYSPILTAAVLIVVVLSVFLTIKGGDRLTKLQTAVSDLNERFVNMVKDLLSGFSVIKSFGAEEEASERLAAKNRALENAKCKCYVMDTGITSIGSAVGNVAQLIVQAVGVYLTVTGSITFGTVMAFSQLMNFVNRPIMYLPRLWAAQKAASALIDKMADYAAENVQEEGTNQLAQECPDIVLEKVRFGYDEEKVVLKDVDIRFEKGKSYAIVGPSGSGKSTVINLLLGGFSNYEGRILFDGVELRTIQRDDLYNVMSVIQQNVFVFDSTIEENITMFKQYDPDKVRQVIARSGLKVFMQEKGNDYLCGENGANLSGGEKQRISIARSLLKNASVLLVDEATAALDTTTAAGVTNEILSLEGITKIVVTHRLDKELLERFDEIIVIHNGVVEEMGKFNALMEQKQMFYSMYHVGAVGKDPDK